VEWIIGAGENGYGGLIRQDTHLFQTPLSFYSKPGRWELSPGYELGNLGFNRPILPGCISCHSGRPNAVADGNGRFEDPQFSEKWRLVAKTAMVPGLNMWFRRS